MLREVVNGYRSWRRRGRSHAELGRLDARLRADIGLPVDGDISLIGSGWYTRNQTQR